MGQSRADQGTTARAKHARAVSRTCMCVALATTPSIGLITAAGAATFGGAPVALTSGAAASGAPTGGLTFHDPLPPPPPPPPPPHPDPHPAPPPPPPPHPDPHPAPPPPPPPPHPHDPPPPPPPPPPPAAQKIVVPWLNGLAKAADGEDQEDLDVVLDVSELSDTAGDDLIDAGVTSGSDASSWDPITVDPTP
jgi:hypothetical protein